MGGGRRSGVDREGALGANRAFALKRGFSIPGGDFGDLGCRKGSILGNIKAEDGFIVTMEWKWLET